jgi:hypothetical protein
MIRLGGEGENSCGVEEGGKLRAALDQPPQVGDAGMFFYSLVRQPPKFGDAGVFHVETSHLKCSRVAE